MKPLQRAWVQHLCWIALLALVWQCVYWSGTVSPLLLPGIPEVLRELGKALVNGRLAEQIAFSLGVILAGIAIALAGALLLSALALRYRAVASLADTLCMLAHPLPAVALLPLIIVWFGVGMRAIVVIIVHSVLWPLVVNMLGGFRAVRKIHIDTGKSLGLNPVKMLAYIYIPAGAAQIFAGVKIGWARAWRALISAEMIFGAVGGSGGIGWYMFQSRVLMNTPGLYAGIITVVVIGIGMELLFGLMERKTFVRWGER